MAQFQLANISPVTGAAAVAIAADTPAEANGEALPQSISFGRLLQADPSAHAAEAASCGGAAGKAAIGGAAGTTHPQTAQPGLMVADPANPSEIEERLVVSGLVEGLMPKGSEATAEESDETGAGTGTGDDAALSIGDTPVATTWLGWPLFMEARAALRNAGPSEIEPVPAEIAAGTASAGAAQWCTVLDSTAAGADGGRGCGPGRLAGESLSETLISSGLVSADRPLAAEPAVQLPPMAAASMEPVTSADETEATGQMIDFTEAGSLDDAALGQPNGEPIAGGRGEETRIHLVERLRDWRIEERLAARRMSDGKALPAVASKIAALATAAKGEGVQVAGDGRPALLANGPSLQGAQRVQSLTLSGGPATKPSMSIDSLGFSVPVATTDTTPVTATVVGGAGIPTSHPASSLPIAVDTTLAIATTAKDESISAIQQPGKPLGVDVSVSAGSHLKSSPATTDTAQVTVPTAIADQGIASGWASTDSDRRPAFSAGGPAKENQLLAEPLTPPGGPPTVALSGSTGSTDRAAPIDEVPRTATVVKNAKEAAGPLPMSDRQAASILFREPIGGPSPDAVTMPSTTRPEAMVETVAAIRPEGSAGPTYNGPLTQASSPSPSPALSDVSTDHAALPAAPGLLNLNQKNWERMLGHQLNWVVNNRLPEAEIKVNPPDLGPLEVRVSLRHNQTDVAFFSHEAAVREALENALPRLREMLDSQGINLNQAQVFDQSSARQQAGAGEQFASGQRGGSSTPTPDPKPVIEETKSAPRSRGLLGMVDDYA